MRIAIKTALAAAAATAAAALVAVLLFGRQNRDDNSLQALRDADAIRVGYAVEPPHAFLKPGGEVTGQSPELARTIIAQMGIGRIDWRMAEFGELISLLEKGRIDVIAAGMFITPERARRVAFSEPIFQVSQGLLVAKGNPLSLHSYADAGKRHGARVAVLSGAVEEKMLVASGVDAGRLVRVPDARTGLTAVETGMADGLALSAPTIAWMGGAGQLGRTEPAQPFAQPPEQLTRGFGYGAFVFRKGDKALLAAWNAAQKEIMAGPRYKEIMAAFGFTPEDDPGTVTTREILAR